MLLFYLDWNHFLREKQENVDNHLGVIFAYVSTVDPFAVTKLSQSCTTWRNIHSFRRPSDRTFGFFGRSTARIQN